MVVLRYSLVGLLVVSYWLPLPSSLPRRLGDSCPRYLVSLLSNTLITQLCFDI